MHIVAKDTVVMLPFQDKLDSRVFWTLHTSSMDTFFVFLSLFLLHWSTKASTGWKSFHSGEVEERLRGLENVIQASIDKVVRSKWVNYLLN